MGIENYSGIKNRSFCLLKNITNGWIIQWKWDGVCVCVCGKRKHRQQPEKYGI